MTITRTEFTSGLRVVTERMPGVRSVSIGIWVLAGSRDERPAISGHCHFLEHLLFKGTEKRSALDIAEAFDAVGGDVNAFTAKEYTCYYARVLDRDLEMAVEHLVDMLLHSTITATDLAGEADVILSEIDMHEDSPEDMVHDVFTEALWPGHPLGRPILGTKDRIKAASRASVRGFYRRHYVPGRMVISVAGNVRHDRVLAMLADRMDVGRPLGVRGRSAKEVRDMHRAPKPSGQREIKRKRIEQAHIVLGTNGLARTDDDRFAFLIVNTVLGGGMSSRLFQEIREKRGLVYSVGSALTHYAGTGSFSVYAGCSPKRVPEVLRLVREELARVAEEGLTAEEVARGRGQLKGGLVLGLEDTGSRMSRLGKSELSYGEYLPVREVLARLDAVDEEQVRAVGADLLTRETCLAVVGPYRESDLDKL